MHRKFTKSWIKHLDFILLDLVVLQISLVLAYFIRHGEWYLYDNSLYSNMSLFLLLLDFIVVIMTETFKNVLKRGYYKEFAITIKHVFLIVVFSVLYLFTVKEGEAYSRAVMYLMGVLYGIIGYSTRIGWKFILKKRMSKVGVIPLLVITNRDMATSVIKNIRKNNYKFYNIIGISLVDCDMTGQEIEKIPVVADIDSVAEYICREWVSEVLVVVNPEVRYSQTMLSQLMETGVTVHVNISDVFGDNKNKQIVEKIADYTVVTSSISYATTRQLVIKRAVDIVGALVGCVITALLFVVLGPIIYIKSPGPIFFSQTRIGKNGKKFKLYKFRSMYPDAEERKAELMKQNRVKDGMMFKVDFDTRIIGNEISPSGEKKTGIGHFIRRTSLDEFPQFFNVLKGDMSLVGTRPPTEDEYGKYKLHHRARLAIKPGITGLWQVSGRSNITNFEEVVKLDTKYITEWSMGLDFKILLQTVLMIFKPKGAM